MRHLPVLLLLTLLSAACQTEPVPAGTADDSYIVISDNLPNSSVTAIAEDGRGYIWMGTARGLGRYNGQNWHQYFHVPDNPSSLPNNRITDLLLDSRGRFWVATADGVCLMEDADHFRAIPYDSASEYMRDLFELSGKIYVNSGVDLLEYDEEKGRFVSRRHFETGEWPEDIQVDPNGRLWILNNGLLTCYNPDGLSSQGRFTIGKGVYSFYLLPNGWLWAASGGGLLIWDTLSDSPVEMGAPLGNVVARRGTTISSIAQMDVSHVLIATANQGMFCLNLLDGSLASQYSQSFPFRTDMSGVTHIYPDRTGNIWLGNDNDGFAVAYSNHSTFSDDTALSSTFARRPIESQCRTEDGRLLILTSAGNVFQADTTGRIQPMTPDWEPDGAFRCLYADGAGDIWLATRDQLYRSRPDDAGRLKLLESHEISLVCGMLEDNRGTLWVLNVGTGVYYRRKGESRFEFLELYHLNIYGYLSDIIQLQDGRLLCSGFVTGLYTIDPDTFAVEHVFDTFNRHHIRTFTPTTLFQSRDGSIWIGTQGLGVLLYDPQTDLYSEVPDLACKDIVSLTEDDDDVLWIGTQNGLSRYNRSSGTITNFTKSDGIGGMEFSRRGVSRWNGHLVFSGRHGFTVFRPGQTDTLLPVHLYFEDLFVDNQRVFPEGKSLRETQEIRLSHKNESFNITISTTEFSEFPSNHFFYQLEGYDKDWHATVGTSSITYSHVPAGSYTLIARLLDNISGDLMAQNSIRVTILPSVWGTPLMRWCGIPMAVLLALGFLFFYYHKINKSRLEAQEAKQYSDFLVNLSHEFRTPLMMMSGPVSLLAEREGFDSETQNYIQLIRQSVSRMQSLVEQLLDVSKLEYGALRLELVCSDVRSILRMLISIFTFNASKKHIEIEGRGIDGSFFMLLDTDKFNKIMTNLLSNALKFTPATGDGHIEVSFWEISREEAAREFPLTYKDGSSRYAKFTVGDNGIGIEEDKLESIFDRFTQLDNAQAVNTPGSGIGLNYVRKLVTLHLGYIKAACQPGGKGSVFSFILPLDESVYDEKYIRAGAPVSSKETALSLQTENRDTHHSTILIVEDDVDAVNYLQILLSPHYNVVYRFDATLAYEEIVQINPDVILSDIMIPGMDGFEFCSRIKQGIETSHIPLILLSARASEEDQIKGLGLGADAYVTKPFNPSYLLALIKTLLDNREKLRASLNKATSINRIPEENTLSPQDRFFLQRLYEIMETDLATSDLDVDHVTELLKMSRTKFYYKFKSLVNDSPNAFFKRYRLNRAAELIQEGSLNFSEIAEKTGFATLAHFSSSFKAQFGVSPSEYGFKKDKRQTGGS